MQFDSLAAVDLGSNSFHLQVGRVVDDQIYLLDSLREPVRLAGGLTRDKRIDRATQLRALEALARFGERLRGFPAGAVRAVGTNTLRVAKNAPQFIEDAHAALGFPIEVIFGREEARLIYLGVSHSLPLAAHRRLVLDIGGGSTEFVIGTGYEPELMESLPMGCVSYSMRFFPDGRIEKSGMKKAELAASNEIERIARDFRRAGWKDVVASSGTAKAVAAVLAANGWAQGGITAEGLDRLRSQMIKAGDVDRLDSLGVRGDRAPIIPGGLAIMLAAFAEFGLESVEVSDAALRQGVLYDLLGRVQHHDMREMTVRQFVRRYHVDGAQGERVRALASQLLGDLSDRTREADQLLIGWAAQLHEIGLSIAHAAYHKHSAYILSNADMPGFSRDEQARVARIVLAHRGKLSKIDGLPARSPDWALVFSLRVAALVYRSRVDLELPRIGCKASDSGYQLAVPAAWLEANPLTATALEAEAEEWRAVGLRFDVRVQAADRAQAAG
ncbi:MAG TPA: exopolyphosphatase [Burkholderiales bacterium]|nr:exopolyphosphatase [Burkholderiales bacterium]